MNFKEFLKEDGIVDNVKKELPRLEGEVSNHIIANPNSVASTLLTSLKTAIMSNHAGDIKTAKERLDQILHPDMNVRGEKSSSEHQDLKTQLVTFKQQVFEIKNMLGSEQNEQFNNIQRRFQSVSSNADEVKKLNDELRILRGSLGKTAKSPEKFSLGRTSKALEKSGIIKPDGTVNKDSEGKLIIPQNPVSLKKIVSKPTPMDKFANKLKKGFEITPKPTDVQEPEISLEPRMSISDIGKPKQTSLISQEKLLDDNKSTIPPEMYTSAKNAIQKANSTNDPEDVKIAEELINNALENA